MKVTTDRAETSRVLVCMGLLLLLFCTPEAYALQKDKPDKLDEIEKEIQAEVDQVALHYRNREYKDEFLQGYITELGQSLVPAETPQGILFSFRVIDDPVPSAVAFPDGRIFIHSGLLTFVENEAQLVTILGHEIGHVVERHAVEAIKEARSFKRNLSFQPSQGSPLQRSHGMDSSPRPPRSNQLTFEALDQEGNSYHGQFFLMVDPQVAVPQLSPLARQVLREEVKSAPVYDAPAIVVGPDVPDRIDGKVLDLKAEITDKYGLRRVVLEVNGKDIEEILFQNSRPARKRGGFRLSKQLPGEVSGDGLRLSIAIPVELKKSVNAVSLRAENVMGMRAREGKTVLRSDD